MREESYDVIKVLKNRLDEEKVVKLKRRVDDSQGFLRGKCNYISEFSA